MRVRATGRLLAIKYSDTRLERHSDRDVVIELGYSQVYKYISRY